MKKILKTEIKLTTSAKEDSHRESIRMRVSLFSFQIDSPLLNLKNVQKMKKINHQFRERSHKVCLL